MIRASAPPPDHRRGRLPSVRLPITAAVCTRDRGAQVVRTVESILRSDIQPLEILIVDQSASPETADALAPFLGGSDRIRYIPTGTAGVARARNLALRAAATPIVAFTDDDCEVAVNWLSEIHRTMLQDETVILAIASVAEAEHDRALGSVPHRIFERNHTFDSALSFRREIGMGAGMALRRDAVLQLGGFDEELGPGGRFACGEDHDLALRVLLAGGRIAAISSTSVVHHGFRTTEEFRALMRRDWIGLGAVYAKLLRCRKWPVLIPLAYKVLGEGLLKPLRMLLSRQRPKGFRRAFYFIQGFRAALSAPLERDQLLFSFPTGGEP